MRINKGNAKEMCIRDRSKVPEGGWTQESFYTENGVRLVQDWVKMNRSATVSYTHLDVYKRQTSFITTWGEEWRRDGKTCDLVFVDCPGHVPVSYTHLFAGQITPTHRQHGT